MANSKLLGTKFKLHPKVFEQILLAVKKHGKPSKRANYILKKAERDPQDRLPMLTYEATKRIYHDITHMELEDDKSNIAYEMMGGDFMKEWCKFALDKARNEVKQKKNARKDVGLKVRDKDPDDEDQTKITIDPTDTVDDRDIDPVKPELNESIERIKNLIKTL